MAEIKTATNNVVVEKSYMDDRLIGLSIRAHDPETHMTPAEARQLARDLEDHAAAAEKVDGQ